MTPLWLLTDIREPNAWEDYGTRKYDYTGLAFSGSGRIPGLPDDPDTTVIRKGTCSGSGAAVCFHPTLLSCKAILPTGLRVFTHGAYAYVTWNKSRGWPLIMVYIFEDDYTVSTSFEWEYGAFWWGSPKCSRWTQVIGKPSAKEFIYSGRGTIYDTIPKWTGNAADVPAIIEACIATAYADVAKATYSGSRTWGLDAQAVRYEAEYTTFPQDMKELWTQYDVIGKITDGYLNCLFREAYQEMVRSIPEATCNTLANIGEVLSGVADTWSAIKDASRGNLRSLAGLAPHGASAGWLFYRYQISTTQMDLDEYKELTTRLVALSSLDAIPCYGFVSDGEYDVRVSCKIAVADIMPKTTRKWLEAYGLKLSAYNAWDMIPYSFIVDWFLHIGDFLEWFETAGKALTLPVSDCWVSTVHHYDDGGSCYIRTPYTYTQGLPFLIHRPISNRTFLFRVFDSIALVFRQ